MSFLVMLAISIALSYIAYLLAPKPKQPKPPAAQDMESPTASAGRPVPVIFGTVTIKGLNVMWSGDKSKSTYEVKA